MKIVLAVAADWQGLYVDGNLKIENHSIKFADLMVVMVGMGEPVTEFTTIDVNADWLDGMGRLPPCLDEVEGTFSKLVVTRDGFVESRKSKALKIAMQYGWYLDGGKYTRADGGTGYWDEKDVISFYEHLTSITC